jgi:hypothetical protein
LAQSLQDTISKKNKTITKRAGVVAWVVECLPSKCEALSLFPLEKWPWNYLGSCVQQKKNSSKMQRFSKSDSKVY